MDAYFTGESAYAMASTVATLWVSQSASIVYQIAAGSTTSQGAFSADKYFSGGGPETPSVTKPNTSAVNNPAPAAVYQSGRYGSFSYTLPNLVAGQVYTVRLHFAEIVFTAPLQRQFSATINSNPVLTNFDVFATAGGANQAIVETFSAAASSSGQIVINFTGTVAAPILSGLEVVSGFRVSSGGPGASYWETDQGYAGGGISPLSAATINTTGVTDAAPAIVYDYSRYGVTTYTFHNLTAGLSYAVRLHFADAVFQTVGQREFNVTINGAPVLTNYDIIGSAGAPDVAAVQEFTAAANSSGEIVVAFTIGNQSGPEVSGIELVGGGGSVVGAGQYEISGYVLLGGPGQSDGVGVPNATVLLSGSLSAVAVSAANGSYAFVVPPGSYVLSVSLPPQWGVSPPIPVTVTNASLPNEDFTAALGSGGSLTPSTPNKEYIFMNGAIVAVEHPH